MAGIQLAEMTRYVTAVLLIVLQATSGNADKPEYGHWSEWGAPSPCTVTCGSGTQTKVREWIPGPDEPKPVVPFTSSQSYVCSNEVYKHCPIDGRWSAWYGWSACSEVCGKGTRVRSRYCEPPKYKGKPCEGKTEETKHCIRAPCPRLPPNFDMKQCQPIVNFTCASNKMCVPRSERCDGTVHCHDGSDEVQCPVPGKYSVRYGLSIGGGAETVLPTFLFILCSISMTFFMIFVKH